MLQLANEQLRVELLHPVDDRARLGPRFCWGGYIWQVHDSKVGSLLTGPQWPHPDPLTHNGQGLPESFRHSTTTGDPLLWEGPIGLAPGGGVLERTHDGTIVVTVPCVWQTEVEPERAVFRTRQNVASWSYALERTVEVRGRQLRSHSRLTNRGSAPLTLEWFAHPFFALGADGRVRVTLPRGTQLPENPGFGYAGEELTLHRAFVGEQDGHLEHLGLAPHQPLTARLTHPKLTEVGFTTDFVPFKCVVWANGNTLSLEPFLALHLAPGESREWTLTYDFGPVVNPPSVLRSR